MNFLEDLTQGYSSEVANVIWTCDTHVRLASVMLPSGADGCPVLRGIIHDVPAKGRCGKSVLSVCAVKALQKREVCKTIDMYHDMDGRLS